ncbi:MAG TPA: hypothetical protein VGJ14_14825 [Sporichthyaceae bacterium]
MDGSAGLVRRRGRPPKLNARQVSKARGWAADGVTQTEIARLLSVSRSVISELLTRLGPAPRQTGLLEPDAKAGVADPGTEPEAVGPAVVHSQPGDTGPGDVGPEDVVCAVGAVSDAAAPVRPAPVGPEPVAGAARIGAGSFTSRYAGVMLLHPFLDRVDAAGVLDTACGPGSRRYDDLAVLSATCLAFALGTPTVEAGKHLVRDQLGPAAGITTLPELRTLRPRLAELADGCDPLQLQRRLAARMLDADAPGLGLYFVDDHFVPYAGAKPVPKRGTTPNVATPNAAATTPWSPTTTPGWCVSPPATPAGSRSPCPRRWRSCVRSSARTRRSCSGSTGAGPTRRCSQPAATPARTG